MLNQTQSKLLKDLAIAHDRLVDLNIVYTDNYTGELGEYYATKVLNLTRYSRSTKGADAYDAHNRKYQIKAKVVKPNYTSHTIKGLNPQLFDFLTIVHLNEQFELITIYQFESHPGLTTIRLSRSADFSKQKVDISKFKLLKEDSIAIQNFNKVYQKVISLGFLDSSNVVGKVGELMAAKKLNLQLASSRTQKGYDAIDSDGKKYEIKTRRVYDSTRRIAENRRINNLVGKESDYLIIVVLDYEFQCAGMWLLEPKNIANPKSANLKIVNTTIGVKSIVPSRVSYLKDRELFEIPVKSRGRAKNTAPKTVKNARPKTVKKEAKPTKKYPAYLFVLPTMIIFHFFIKPNYPREEAIYYYIGIGLFAFYLYRKANAKPRDIEDLKTLLRVKTATDKKEEQAPPIPTETVYKNYYIKNNVRINKVEKPAPKINSRRDDIPWECDCDPLNGCDCDHRDC